MKQLLVTVALILLAPVVTLANDPADSDPPMGRIFMTQAERDELDRLRRLPPPSERAGPATSTDIAAAPEEGPEGTGYILRSRGGAWMWVDGDFRSVGPAELDRSTRLPEIRIVRHRGADSDDGDAGGKDDADGN